jgi:hypothetical protein
MQKVKDNYIAELIIAAVITTMLLASCGSTSGLCPSYSQEQSMEEYYSSLDCQNCDEVD